MEKVVIVDDSETARMFTRRCFEMAGLKCSNVVELSDAREAVPLLLSSEVDLLVIDLVMPHMTGKDLLVERKKQGSTVPVIVVSSAVNQAESEELVSLGATIVIKKPLSPAGAARALERLALE